MSENGANGKNGAATPAAAYDGPPWEFIRLPAINDEGQPLWPSRYNLGDLALIRAQVEEYNWWSQYMQKPRPRGGTVFPEWHVYDELVLAGRFIAMAVDTAITKKTTSDWAAAGVAAMHGVLDQFQDEKGNTRTLRRLRMDVIRAERWKVESPELCANLVELQKDYPSAPLIIETSGVGLTVAQHLRQLEPRLRLVEIVSSSDKFLRAQPLIGGIRRGHARVPRNAPWVKDYLAEFRAFEAKLGHRHDDQVDWTAHLWNWGEQAIGSLAGGVKVSSSTQLGGGGF